MRRATSCGWVVGFMALACGWPGAARAEAARITPAASRWAVTDLEVTGLLPGLAAGRTGYVRRSQLETLPQVTIEVAEDENLPHGAGASVRVRGVRLSVLREALGALEAADVTDAWCTDQYRAHYPASYVAAHEPVLAWKVNGLAPSTWAAGAHARDPGSYFITHERFVPAFRVLAHEEEAQIPTNVVRLNFTTSALAFGPVTPRGQDLAVQQGFAIAKQNCLRCHFLGGAGGTKSGRDWQIVSLWARQKPDYFTGYVHDPRSKDPKSEMPGFPQYDAATLGALLAYFQSFPAGARAGGR